MKSDLIFQYLVDCSNDAYYAGGKKLANHINQYLLRTANNDGDRTTVLANLCFSIPNLRSVLPSQTSIHHRELGTQAVPDQYKGFHAMNPSIALHPVTNEMHMNVRYVNYNITQDGSYAIANGKHQVITHNLYNDTIWMDAPSKDDATIIGYEDVRLFFHLGECMGLATTPMFVGINQMCLLRYTGAGDPQHYNAKIIDYMPDQCQKNWIALPSISKKKNGGGDLQIIYDHNPLTILRILETDLCSADTVITPYAIEKYEHIIFKHWRGSTPAVTVSGMNLYLYVVHEVGGVHNEPNKRVYYHRFVLLADTFSECKASDLFFIDTIGVEYVSGLALDASNNTLHITYGKNDASAHSLTCSLRSVLRFVTKSHHKGRHPFLFTS